MIYGDRIFQLADDGVLSAINKHTGHSFWTVALGTLSASSPAASRQHRLRHDPRKRAPLAPGRIVALNCQPARSAGFARCRARASPPAARSRPLFFGSQNGTVYALNARNGACALDLPRRRLGQGQPDARPAACSTSATIRATSRRSPSAPGGGSGAAAPGRAARQRHLLLDRRRRLRARLPRQHRRAHVCLRRVHRQARLGRADRRLRLLLARGHQRARPRTDHLLRLLQRHLLRRQRPLRSDQLAVQRARAHLRLGHDRRQTVYFADLGQHRTYGLGISTGRPLFQMDTGAFDPVISDGSDIYLTGYTGLYALAPLPAEHPASDRRSARTASSRKRARKREASSDDSDARAREPHTRPAARSARDASMPPRRASRSA